MIRFGPAGNSDAFYAEGYKTSLDVCQWLRNNDLDAYEYQCTRGVKVSKIFCETLAEQAKRFDIKLSIHAPYYINLASDDPSIIANSQKHIIDSLVAANYMGAERVVFHPGAGKGDRTLALQRALEALGKIIAEAEAQGLLERVLLCPETMGKVNQLGSLNEVLELCSLHQSIRPAVDFGHLYAISFGKLETTKDYAQILNRIDKVLGSESLAKLHVHFSPIEYTQAGEKKHRTLKEKEFGPDFFPLAQEIIKRQMEPVIICESAGSQAEDARALRDIYNFALKNNKTLERG